MRHCEAKKHPVLGYTLDELTPDGEKQAIHLAKSFKFNANHLISSPYQRALRTAQLIAEIRKLEITSNDNWGELNRGIYAKRPYQEFLEVLAQHNYDYNYIPPEGESINQGRKRIIKGLNDLLRFDGDVLCVTHAGLISNLLMMLYSFDFERGKPPFGGICELSFDGSKFILYPTANNHFLGIASELYAPQEKLNLFNR